MADLACKNNSSLMFGICLLSQFWSATMPLPVHGADQSAIPNFASNSNIGWIASGSGFGTDFVQPPSGPGPVTNDPAHPYITNAAAAASGRQPTFRVADLTNPILQPWAVAQMKKANQDVLAGKVAFTADARCFAAGVPSFLLYPANPVRFLQTPREVVMIWQQDAQTRHVYLNQPHSAHPMPSWYGESVGHYEGGDTLVVDTIGLNDKTFVDNYRTPHTTQLHVVERYTIAPDRKSMGATISVEDPGAFTSKWSASQRYILHNTPIAEGENVCAENNDSNYFHEDEIPIPQSTVPDF
jgi:hypothetical protein